MALHHDELPKHIMMVNVIRSNDAIQQVIHDALYQVKRSNDAQYAIVVHGAALHAMANHMKS